MNKKRDGYLIVAALVSIASIVVSASSLVIAKLGEIKNTYPDFSYRDCVNQSENMLYSNKAGSQLYEAERATLSDGVEANSSFASNYSYLSLDKSGARVLWQIDSDEKCEAEMVISTAIVSSFDTEAGSVFALEVNGERISSDQKLTSSHSNSDFKENNLGEISLKQGRNEIILTNIGSAFSIDYIALVSSKAKTSDDKTIGQIYRPFYSGGTEQIYELESGLMEGGAYIEEESDASWGHYCSMPKANSSVTYYLDSDDECTTNLVLKGKIDNDSKNIISVLSVSIDGKPVICSPCYITKEYERLDILDLNLTKGQHSITFTSLIGGVSLDCFSLGSEITYSSHANGNLYQAENANLYLCAVENNVTSSGERDVGHIQIGAVLTYSFNSRTKDTTHLSLSICPFGIHDDTSLSSLLSVSVNGENLSLDSYAVTPSSSYDAYQVVSLGEANIKEGTNNIVITSLVDNMFNLDYLTTYKASSIGQNLHIEAEDTPLIGNGRKEFLSMNDEKENVGHLATSSALVIQFESLSPSFALGFSYSSDFSDDIYFLTDVISLNVNGVALDNSSYIFTNGNNWNKYYFMSISGIEGRVGLNTITIKMCTNPINFDYFTISY